MNKTEKEIAFLHGLYVENEWKPKFSAIFDESFKDSKDETFLYVNAGAGDHALLVRENLDKDTQLFAVCESGELQKIAQAKADAVKADLDFSTSMPYAESDFVLVDSSLVDPRNLPQFIQEMAKLTKRSIVFFVPTAGSFGEVFSYLWEILLEMDLVENEDVEKLISGLPSDLKLEEILKNAGFKNVESKTKAEFIEFASGGEFVNSPLMEYFLFPMWFGFLDEKEREKAVKKLAQKIDNEHKNMSFRLSVKATVLYGDKA